MKLHGANSSLAQQVISLKNSLQKERASSEQDKHSLNLQISQKIEELKQKEALIKERDSRIATLTQSNPLSSQPSLSQLRVVNKHENG